MNLQTQRRIAAAVLGIGLDRIWFDPQRHADIKQAITRRDIKHLIAQGVIRVHPVQGVSRVRARERIVQRRKGRQQGTGSRKGPRTARLSRKEEWKHRVRKLRELLSTLKEKNYITPALYQEFRLRTKGGFFRNRRHALLYLRERGIFKK